MGYAIQVDSADLHLREKVGQAILAAIEPLLNSANADLKALARAIAQNPTRVVQIVTQQISQSNSITVESTDAQIDTAVGATSTVDLMKAHFNIGS